MGGIVGGILGKKSAKKEASNVRAAAERSAKIVEPFVKTGVQASGAVAGALGLEGGAEQDVAFQNFLGSTGFRSQVKAGTEAITGNAAARGLLQSGATLKGITTFGQEKAQAGFSNFLANLQQTAGRGASAGVGQAQQLQQAGVQSAAAIREGQDRLISGIGQTAQSVFGSIF